MEVVCFQKIFFSLALCQWDKWKVYSCGSFFYYFLMSRCDIKAVGLLWNFFSFWVEIIIFHITQAIFHTLFNRVDERHKLFVIWTKSTDSNKSISILRSYFTASWHALMETFAKNIGTTSICFWDTLSKWNF